MEQKFYKKLTEIASYRRRTLPLAGSFDQGAANQRPRRKRGRLRSRIAQTASAKVEGSGTAVPNTCNAPVLVPEPITQGCAMPPTLD